MRRCGLLAVPALLLAACGALVVGIALLLALASGENGEYPEETFDDAEAAVDDVRRSLDGAEEPCPFPDPRECEIWKCDRHPECRLDPDIVCRCPEVVAAAPRSVATGEEDRLESFRRAWPELGATLVAALAAVSDALVQLDGFALAGSTVATG